MPRLLTASSLLTVQPAEVDSSQGTAYCFVTLGYHLVLSRSFCHVQWGISLSTGGKEVLGHSSGSCCPPPHKAGDPLQHCLTRGCLGTAFLHLCHLSATYIFCLPNAQNNFQLESLTLVSWFPQQITLGRVWERLHLQWTLIKMN